MIFAGVCEVRRHNMCVFQDGHNVRLGHHVALKSCRDLAKRCQPTCWTNLAVFYYGKPLKSRTCSFSRVSSRKELLMLSCSMFLRHSHHADHLDYAVLCQCWLTLSCNWRCVSVAWKPLKLSMHGSSLTKWFAKFHNIHDVWRWWGRTAQIQIYTLYKLSHYVGGVKKSLPVTALWSVLQAQNNNLSPLTHILCCLYKTHLLYIHCCICQNIIFTSKP